VNNETPSDATVATPSWSSRLRGLWARYDAPPEARNSTVAQKSLTDGESILQVGKFHTIFWKLRWVVYALALLVIVMAGSRIFYDGNYFIHKFSVFLHTFKMVAGADEVLQVNNTPQFMQSLPHLGFVGAGLVAIKISLLLSLLYRCYTYNRVYQTEFVLTNQRLITKKGYLRPVLHEMQLQKIDSIDYGQTIFERWLGVGHLRVGATNGGKVTKFTYLLDASQFRTRILEQIDNVSP